MLKVDVMYEKQHDLFSAFPLFYRLIGIYEDLVFILASPFYPSKLALSRNSIYFVAISNPFA